ncbi:MAG: hypothetical protein Q9202_007309 [Teloschistes flavicans]
MESKEYRIIGSEPVNDEELDNLYGPKYSRKVRCLSYIAPVLLALSLAANILLLAHRLVPNTLVSAPLRSTFGLERNKRIAWTENNDFASHNRTVWDQAWSTLNADTGLVAISDDLLLRTALVDMHDKKPQSIHFSHINHCLDGLRQDIMCNADDTPRYTGMGHLRGTGIGQYRMCRDWDQLEQWADDHSACYQYDDGSELETLRNGVPLSHFKHCPSGTEPWKDERGNA